MPSGLIQGSGGRYARITMRAAAFGWLLAWAIGTGACATYEQDLLRGQYAFEDSEHERALSIFRALEPDVPRLSIGNRAHYAYLRGMTDYRIGYKADARHWLSLAAAIEQQAPGALPADWAKRMQDSLRELNDEVYSAGIQSLSNTSEPPTTKSKGSSDTPRTREHRAPEDAPGGTSRSDEY